MRQTGLNAQIIGYRYICQLIPGIGERNEKLYVSKYG